MFENFYDTSFTFHPISLKNIFNNGEKAIERYFFVVFEKIYFHFVKTRYNLTISNNYTNKII